MKIAILLTGQLRSVDFQKNFHKKLLLDKYDTDVFLSIDLDNNLQRHYYNTTESTNPTVVEKVIKFFNPKKYFLLNDFEDEFNNNINIFNKEININMYEREDISYYKRPLRQYYLVKNAYKLLIDYIKENKTQYDIIIRLRFDQYIYNDNTEDILNQLNNINLCSLNISDTGETFIKSSYEDNDKNSTLLNNIIDLNNKNCFNKICFNEILDNYIYVFNSGIYFNKHNISADEQNFYANDQFWYHNTSLLYKMYKFYDEIIYLIIYRFKNNIYIFDTSTENLFYTFLINNNIDIGISSIKGIFVREYSKKLK
jgi:hypothetical protein